MTREEVRTIAKAAKKSSGSGKARSAKTGRYVTKKHAKQNPSTTVIERS